MLCGLCYNQSGLQSGLLSEQKNNNKKNFLETHLGLLHSPLLKGTSARVVGAVMSVFTPVALVGTTHT